MWMQLAFAGDSLNPISNTNHPFRWIRRKPEQDTESARPMPCRLCSGENYILWHLNY